MNGCLWRAGGKEKEEGEKMGGVVAVFSYPCNILFLLNQEIYN